MTRAELNKKVDTLMAEADRLIAQSLIAESDTVIAEAENLEDRWYANPNFDQEGLA